MNDKKDLSVFIERVSRLETIEFIGLARILCVELMEKNKLRPFDKIIADMIESYSTAARKTKKQVSAILKAATSKKRGE